MRGSFRPFDKTSNTGFIIGEDGNRYAFSSSDIIDIPDGIELNSPHTVEFDLEGKSAKNVKFGTLPPPAPRESSSSPQHPATQNDDLSPPAPHESSSSPQHPATQNDDLSPPAPRESSSSPQHAATPNFVTLKNESSGQIMSIKIGWSWTGFFFCSFFGVWFFIRKLYFQGAGVIAVFAINFALVSSGARSGDGLIMFNIMLLILSILVGIMGNKMTAKNLLKKGWVFVEPDSPATIRAKSIWKL
jgi:hypothetical protein